MDHAFASTPDAPVHPSTPRLFVGGPLDAGAQVVVDGQQAHYLGAVMRLSTGGAVRLCDDATGEWLARVETIERRRIGLVIERRLRRIALRDGPWLCAAPIKAARWDWLVEKATELGIDRLVPVGTQRGIVDKVKPDRVIAQMIEAAEQCGRTTLPALAPLTGLGALMRDWPADRRLFWADERGGDALPQAWRPGPVALLVGPEGGFTDAERAMLAAHPQTTAITLGPRILRAETAALAGLAVLESLARA